MSNLFDELNGLNVDQNLDGLLSKVARKVRKATRKVRKAARKITPKPLRKVMNKLEAEGRRMDRKGLTKKLAIVAAGVGLAFVGGPAIIAGLKGAGGIAAKGVGLAAKGIGAAKGVIGATTVSNVVKTGMQYKAAKDQMKMEDAMATQQAQEELAATRGLTQAIGQTPEFRQVVDELRSQGYSDTEILQHWVESKTYYQSAVAQATQTVYPQIKQSYVDYGMSEDDADTYATVEAHKIATQAVDEVKSKVTGGNLLLPAALLIFSLMG